MSNTDLSVDRIVKYSPHCQSGLIPNSGWLHGGGCGGTAVACLLNYNVVSFVKTLKANNLKYSLSFKVVSVRQSGSEDRMAMVTVGQCVGQCGTMWDNGHPREHWRPKILTDHATAKNQRAARQKFQICCRGKVWGLKLDSV